MPFRAGDMIGFSGRGWVAFLIRLFSCGLFGRGPRLSHVGIVVKHPMFGTSLIFEATSCCNLRCLSAGKKVSGVQSHLLHERIARCRGQVWHYPLADPLTDNQAGALRMMAVACLGRPYDWWGAWLSRRTLLRWLTRRWIESRGDARLFCSEFVPWCWLAARGNIMPTDLAPTPLARLLVKRGICRPPIEVERRTLGV